MTTGDKRSTEARWDPQQYGQFREERAEPFYDLAALVQRRPGMRVVDLGCGPGDMTAWLHGELGAAETVGIDSSDEMLAVARPYAAGGLRFEQHDIVDFAARGGDGPYDLIFSNAALQWVGGHEALLGDLTRMLAPGGQIAIQVPSGGGHPASQILGTLTAEEPYASVMMANRRARSTLTPDAYARLLYELGYVARHVRMQVYGHILPEALSVVEWFKGSALGPYRSHLPPDMYAALVAEYERRVVAQCGQGEPYFLPFNRILMWGRI
jgi:trans-aconitate 2-methyltransferase